jgi:hypothetical protein
VVPLLKTHCLRLILWYHALQVWVVVEQRLELLVDHLCLFLLSQ